MVSFESGFVVFVFVVATGCGLEPVVEGVGALAKDFVPAVFGYKSSI